MKKIAAIGLTVAIFVTGCSQSAKKIEAVHIPPTAHAGDLLAGAEAYNRGDFAAALREWRPLAEQGDALAQLYLSVMYANGDGVPQNDAEATKWYRKATEQGDAGAQYLLGRMYEDGDGVRQDDAEAVKWYRKAAEQGIAGAQFYLGVMYHFGGDGVRQDDAEAVKWYRKAAEKGNALAQRSLGGMYAVGKGVPQNDVQAYAWCNIATAQGDKKAEQCKELIAESMTREKRARGQELARQYWEDYVVPFRN